MIITISGNIGSGKSTIGQMLAKKLGYKFYSIGNIMSGIAKKKKMTINELQEIQEIDKTTDINIDNYQRKLGETSDNFIIDSRLGFHFIPHSFKIFLKVDINEGAKRIYNDPRDDEFKAKDINHQIELIKRRVASEKMRYKLYYNLNPEDEKHYNLVIDTTKLSREEVVKKILNHLQKNKKQKIKSKTL